ncbi:MurR/RpiR family transcriptional regulator [Halobacillus sp. A5]|uniref:MurR/RpiR family transcriptional regulator n=1 Tax=Halobacillus sp. A5 TaxID=2880263 RepID=UPI0020A65439|nr:MurR/RpiR family transcriptional regulator [Halobacillus sp. A5]MCP3027903.1 MurR/RpiR family transcriptional regulator [Halobacillus sp. A5]
MSNTLEQLRQCYQDLRRAEQKVAEYILENPFKVLGMPIAKLSEETATSEATIIRMCRSLSLKGYTELKLNISASLNGDKEYKDRYEDISADANLTDIIQLVSNNNMRSIKLTHSLIDEDQMEKAVFALNGARRIAVIGVGASAIVALDFEQKCKRINKWCEAFTDGHSQLTSAVHLTENDVVLAISYSGKTKEIVDTMKVVKERKAQTISITGYGKNVVQKLADVNLYASPIEKNIRSGATASRIAQLNIIDVLFTALASINFEESVRMLDETRAVLRKRT